MVQMWYMDNADFEDQRLPHHLFPPKPISMDKLMKKSGVLYRKMNMEDVGVTKQRVDIIRKERNYKFEDEIVVAENSTQNYEAKIKEFYKEHIREQDEARFILEGQAYFDIQDATDPTGITWFRIFAEKGDFVIIPPGCLHRFTPDTNNYVKMRRFFTHEQHDSHMITGEDVATNSVRLTFLNEMAQKNNTPINKATKMACNENNIVQTDVTVN